MGDEASGCAGSYFLEAHSFEQHHTWFTSISSMESSAVCYTRLQDSFQLALLNSLNHKMLTGPAVRALPLA